MMEFRNPQFLWLLLLWIPMILLYLRRESGSRPAVRFSDISLLKVKRSSSSVYLRHSLLVLRLVGLALLIVALARPRQGHSEEEVTTEGVDIMLLLDVSSSMRALDFKPQNRLYVARETIKDFISRREHDRIGLVVFAGRAYTKCPLTLDYNVVEQLVGDVKFGELEDGTAIGTALATAANRIQRSTAKSRVMILLTDGANNRGEIAPLAAAEAAAQLGIKIYTIGVGRQGKVPYPVDMVDRRTGKVVETRVQMIDSDLDEGTLQKIAKVSGGRYFRASSAEELRDIYHEIDSLEKSEIKTMSYTTWSERFYPWLAAGLACILLELLLSHTRFRRIP